MISKPWSHFSARVWLAAACLACVVLRGPALASGVLSDDEAIYDTMAQEVRAGGVMYKHTVDHKPPGIVYTYAAIESVTSGNSRIRVVHFFGILVAITTCIGLYQIGRLLLCERWAGIPPLLYAVTSATKVPYDGLAVNGELLMNLPLVFGASMALKATRVGGWRRGVFDFAAGGLIAVACLYKYQAAVLLFALPFLLDNRRRDWRKAALWIVGFLLPLTACTVYFSYSGAFQDLVRWAILFNGEYVQSGVTLSWAAMRFARQLLGVVLPGLLLYSAAAVGVVRIATGRDEHTAHRYRGFLLAWSLASLAAVAVGGRFFGHYFLQPELPLSIAAADPVARLWDKARWAVVSSLAAPAVVFTLVACFPGSLGRALDNDRLDYASIGHAIAARTRPTDTIWIWGNAPKLYFASNRRAGVRFTFCNYLTGLSPGTPSEYDPHASRTVSPKTSPKTDAWALALRDLDTNRPQLILDTAAAHWKSYGKFPIQHYRQFADFVRNHYRKGPDIEGAVAYERVTER